MLTAVIPILLCMKVLGFCSLKLVRPVDFHGYFYYLWSFVIIGLTLVCFIELSVTIALRLEYSALFIICQITIVLVYSFMMIEALVNEKKILEILNDVRVFDQQISFNCKAFNKFDLSICWILYEFFKSFIKVHSGLNKTFIAINMIVFLSDMFMLTLVGIIYEQLSVRYTFLCDKLHIRLLSRDTQDFSQLIESIRICYFSLSCIVHKVNIYSGFWIFGSLFNRHLLCFNKANALLKYLNRTLCYKKAILLFPDEFFPIIYLTSKADLLANKVRDIRSSIISLFIVVFRL